MGVPAFFRWLSRKYPSVVVTCTEEKAKVMERITVPVDATQPNPNGVEFDNLYLDMNGIIHPCCHPEDKAAPKDEDEMMIAIFEYIDRIFNIVRPRRLLYMAIDGVAPRAKMNQQRSRRFRSAKESSDKLEEMKRIRQELKDKGCEVPPMKEDHAHFDSNCITPGTSFMDNLSVCLQYYIHERLNNNPAWQGIKVILSDANVPGEGEHKIVDYIRKQRSNPDHDPNTHHCLCGADADLIMLGLATHEPYFTILREEFNPNQNQQKPCEICNQIGHSMKDCTGMAREKAGEFDEMATASYMMEKQFIFLRLTVLREYLERELRMDGLPFPFDLERAIDDWVFMCFFVGNDFLPHLPSLEIREGAIDRLITLYKSVVPQTRGYLTHNGRVNLHYVQLILTELGKVEDEIFKRRRETEMEFRRRNKEKRMRAKMQKIDEYSAPRFIPEGQFAPTPLGNSSTPVRNARLEAAHMRQASMSAVSANYSEAARLKSLLKQSGEETEESFASSQSNTSFVAASPTGSLPASLRPSPTTPSFLGRYSVGSAQKRKVEESQGEEDGEEEEPMDTVKLWEEGWKERYYQDKYGLSSDDGEFVQKVAEAYTRGLCWVFGYYYQGCPSWKWFYPFHYAPFASDFKNISHLNNWFDKGTEPFKPLEQLMGVFPAASAGFLPATWQQLMLDEDSAIIDFYPTNFTVDLNGKKFAWQGVALLPFVDEERLLQALKEVYNDLMPDEIHRNSRGSDYLFVYRYNRLYPLLKGLYENLGTQDITEPQQVQLNPEWSGGVRGSVWVDKRMRHIIESGGVVESPLPCLPNIQRTYAISVRFQDPDYGEDHVFEPKLLESVKMPERTLKPQGYQGNYSPRVGFSYQSGQSQVNTEAAQRTIRRSLPSQQQGNIRTPSPGGYREGPGGYREGYRKDSYHYETPYHSPYNDQRRQSGPAGSSRAVWNSLPPPPSKSMSSSPWAGGNPYSSPSSMYPPPDHYHPSPRSLLPPPTPPSQIRPPSNDRRRSSYF